MEFRWKTLRNPTVFSLVGNLRVGSMVSAIFVNKRCALIESNYQKDKLDVIGTGRVYHLGQEHTENIYLQK